MDYFWFIVIGLIIIECNLICNTNFVNLYTTHYLNINKNIFNYLKLIWILKYHYALTPIILSLKIPHRELR